MRTQDSPPDPHTDPETEPVLVHTFLLEPEAQAAAQALDAHAILYQLLADDCGGMLPPLHQGKGIRLFVARKNANQARSLIAEWASADKSRSE